MFGLGLVSVGQEAYNPFGDIDQLTDQLLVSRRSLLNFYRYIYSLRLTSPFSVLPPAP